MEQNQSISTSLKTSYPLQTSVSYAYPLHHYDAMATHYVHSLTSSPYYYFIPHYSYASGHNYPHHRYAHNGPQSGYSRAMLPTLGLPSEDNQQSHISPKVYTENPKLQRSSAYEGQVEKSEKSSEEVHADGGKSIDPRIINVLEPFRQFYSEREESLKNIFPGLYDKLSEFFKKVNALVLNTVKSNGERSNPRILKRSLSLGSSPLRNEWFKVRPIDSEDTVILPTDGKNGDE